MKKSMLTRALIGALLLVALPTAAQAATQDDDYSSGVDGSLTLAGSDVAGVCHGDEAWISYDVYLTDTEHQSTGDSATLVLTDGAHTASVLLGTLDANGQVSGSVPWPTGADYAWTHGDISATIEVNPTLAVALTYPGCDASVAGAVASGSGNAAELAVTGGDFNPVPWLAGVGIVGMLGLVLFLFTRRRAQ